MNVPSITSYSISVPSSSYDHTYGALDLQEGIRSILQIAKKVVRRCLIVIFLMSVIILFFGSLLIFHYIPSHRDRGNGDIVSHPIKNFLRCIHNDIYACLHQFLSWHKSPRAGDERNAGVLSCFIIDKTVTNVMYLRFIGI